MVDRIKELLTRVGARCSRRTLQRLGAVVNYLEVGRWLGELGFSDVTRTIDHRELFLRAARPGCSARPFLPPPVPPYWFERYRRRFGDSWVETRTVDGDLQVLLKPLGEFRALLEQPGRFML